MQIGQIVPNGALGLIKDRPLHLILAPELKRSAEQAKFYQKEAAGGSHVILDNGAYEEGLSVSLDQLNLWIDFIRPAEVVLPDVMFDGPSTLKMSFDAASELRTTWGQDLKLQGVPQGRTWKEWAESFHLFYLSPLIDTIAVNVVSNKLFPGLGRLRILQEIHRAGFHMAKSYHLLGLHPSLLELTHVPHFFPWVRSIDTSKPASYGLRIRNLRAGLNDVPPYPGRPKDFFGWEILEPVSNSIEHNILITDLAASSAADPVQPIRESM